MKHKKNFYCIHSQIEQNRQFYGCFKIGPFYTHGAQTFANCLRRTLLADQSACVFDTIQIYGIQHEFSSLVGVRESVVDIMFNIENIILCFKGGCQGCPLISKPQIGIINLTGPGILRAHNIYLPKQIGCVNPNQYIATIETDGELNLKLFIHNEKIHQNKKLKKNSNKNYLFLNNDICSIKRINYTIQSISSGEEFILFEIWTNGGIHPKKAISKAINEILLDFLAYSIKINTD